ncbi:hypothetical protein T492DRAFT_112087 [Pavlovales sp. CCMP2436]|nr:hypothetical protein T492DRAFT_112087 [Pavlovales sp. CCMP2436]
MFSASGLLSKSDPIFGLSSLTNQYLATAAVVAACCFFFIACFCLLAAKIWQKMGDEARRGSSMPRKRRNAGRLAEAAPLPERRQIAPERLARMSMRSGTASEDLDIQRQMVFPGFALLTPSASLVHVPKASPEKGVSPEIPEQRRQGAPRCQPLQPDVLKFLAELPEQRRQGAPQCQPLHPEVLKFIGGGYNAHPRHSRVHPDDDADAESPPTTPRGDFEPPVGSLVAIRALDSWASSIISLATLGDRLEAFCSHFVLGGATTARDERGLSGGHSRVSFEPSQATKPTRSSWSTADASDSLSFSISQSAPEPSARATLRENVGVAQGQRVLPLITGRRGSTRVHAVLTHDWARHPRASSEPVDVPELHNRAQGQRVLPLPIQPRGAVITTGQRRGSASTLVLAAGPRRTRVDMHSRVGMRTRIDMHKLRELEEYGS